MTNCVRCDKPVDVTLRGVCDSCTSEVHNMQAIVEAGGVYWKCKVCRNEGAVRAGTELAAIVRQQAGVAAPEAAGVELDESNCPICSGAVDPLELPLASVPG